MLVALVDTLKQLRYQIAHLEDNTLQSEYPELASFIQQVSLTVTESKADLNFLYQFLYVCISAFAGVARFARPRRRAACHVHRRAASPYACLRG